MQARPIASISAVGRRHHSRSQQASAELHLIPSHAVGLPVAESAKQAGCKGRLMRRITLRFIATVRSCT